jgi:hypothetical protein
VNQLLSLLLSAAAGDFPPADGRAVFVGRLAEPLQAVVSFTGHAVLVTDLTEDDFADIPLDGYGAALQPSVLQRLAGGGGIVGVIDVLLAADGSGRGLVLREQQDLEEHPRVQHARAWRRDVRVFGDERGLVTLSRGLADRCELSVESVADAPGVGRSLIRDALGLVDQGEPVFAAVAPGNARSLRAFLATGFRPIGSEVLIWR